ncbi:beta-1,3-galactosyltransferase 5-like isoform X2 [Hyposmocoma kahamanoa]|uniref:beta-1,3-galactosyltransferase 5-like isoform X2 n=1 Tax=Hyposmocoma kahamanoa TaxID=1477025 RepID=UPI000E6D7F85|nr:beta-1,3-galactosyltransferase 5-like isoform X2 [Hyposmocoma kahamanoa]
MASWPRGLRRNVLLLAFALWTILVLTLNRRLSRVTSLALLPPPPPERDLTHFIRSRSLEYYLDNIELLIEPSLEPCLEDIPVIVLAASAPTRWSHREAIRRTWGKRIPTYFLMGLDGPQINEELTNNYIEAKEYRDLIVYDFLEHYQNLTLKTALMLQWTSQRCPEARFLYKTDDDVVINPWRLKEVLIDNAHTELAGYMVNKSSVHRDEYNKWYLPRWLQWEDIVPRYLTGPGYLIHGDHISKLLEGAYKVPLYNLEDVYFTYSVANVTLRYNLTHDSRLCPFKPWVSWFGCAYFRQASIHSLTANEIVKIYWKVEDIGKIYEYDKNVCGFYERYLDRFVFWY